ncbi:MAG: DUF393 domain-containing protein [Flavobacteriaceae bacterium]|nr:DUF393 domain-containing protein [Flavobacteriaceae bacterium]
MQNAVLNNTHHYIIYDGVCVFCNYWVNWLIKRDGKDLFRFIPLQTKLGQTLLLERNISSDKVESIVYIQPEQAYFLKSDAILNLLSELTYWKSFAIVLSVFPRVIRDFFYDFIAANRYTLFGRHQQCEIPPPAIRQKFLLEELD